MRTLIAEAQRTEASSKSRQSQLSILALIAKDDAELAHVDPLEMNLVVAKGIPSLAELDIARYQRIADDCAGEADALIQNVEGRFWQAPSYWKNDIKFFRLGVLAQYIDCNLGIRYHEDQREAQEVLYENPSDLFLNGLMDTRRGTCGNMAAFYVALAWRLAWPVSLACAGSHFFCRYDDGSVIHNIEVTNTGRGGFCSHPDSYYRERDRIPDKAISCGSDLRAVRPRELLGLFVSLRARHFRDTRCFADAERDYLLARFVFPSYRVASREQVAMTALLNSERFDPLEPGHASTLWSLAEEVAAGDPLLQNPIPQLPREEVTYGCDKHFSRTWYVG